jgi:hypothetical protein
VISVASLTVDRAAAGLDYDLDAVPPWQFAIHFGDLAPLCPSRLRPVAGRDYNRQRNALRVEIVPDSDRCLRKSPDGRGIAWLASGGSPIDYGACCPSGCPRSAP